MTRRYPIGIVTAVVVGALFGASISHGSGQRAPGQPAPGPQLPPGATPPPAQMDGLTRAVTDLKAELRELRQTVRDQAGYAGSLAFRLDQLSAKIATDSRVDKLESKVDKLDTKVDKICKALTERKQVPGGFPGLVLDGPC